MKFICDCGEEHEFTRKYSEQRQFFRQSEEVVVGDFDGLSFDLGNPVVMSIEIGCKKCGKFFRTGGRFVEEPLNSN